MVLSQERLTYGFAQAQPDIWMFLSERIKLGSKKRPEDHMGCSLSRATVRFPCEHSQLAKRFPFTKFREIAPFF